MDLKVKEYMDFVLPLVKECGNVSFHFKILILITNRFL